MSSLLSSIVVGLLSCLLGWISSQLKVEHPHQIIPNWMILGALGIILGSIVGLIWAIFLVYKAKNLNLFQSVLRASAFSTLMMILPFSAISFA